MAKEVTYKTRGPYVLRDLDFRVELSLGKVCKLSLSRVRKKLPELEDHSLEEVIEFFNRHAKVPIEISGNKGKVYLASFIYRSNEIAPFVLHWEDYFSLGRPDKIRVESKITPFKD